METKKIDYDIDYDDARFEKVESDKAAALKEVDETYDGMISQSDKYFQDQIDAAENYKNEQAKLQNQQTNQTIKEINQQKDQTKKDYIREQSGAYVDWQKQSNQYGANAEQMAAGGMQNTGYSESSQVGMYNAYQNRVATARESYNQAVLNYDNSITQAKLQNSSVLAEIAYQALQQQLELSLQGFQYKNQLLLQKADQKTAINSEYYQQYQDVLDQINKENQLKETARQFDAAYDYQGGSPEIDKDPPEAENQTESPTEPTTWWEKWTKELWSGILPDKSGGGSSGSSSGSSATIDMDSVLALGYGPVSASKRSELVDQGVVEQYESDGKIKFRKKQQLPFGGLR